MYHIKYLEYKKKYINVKKYGGGDPNDLKINYIDLIDKSLLTSEFKLATYNIHYFTDTYEKNGTYDNIINNINTINADVIVLQEALIGGNNININKDVQLNIANLYSDFKKIGYEKVIFCNIVPSWYDGVYGNLLLIHDRVIKKNCFKPPICEEINEVNSILAKSTTKTTVSGSHEGILETRCFIYVKVKFSKYYFHIYGTHLDISSEDTRKDQLQTIIDNSKQYNNDNDIIFIVGDFNTFNKKDKNYGMENKIWNTDYTKNNGVAIENLENQGFHDLELLYFIKHNTNVIMSTWSNIRVDFIFCNKIPNNFKMSRLYSDASDHLPIILTLPTDVSFSS